MASRRGWLGALAVLALAREAHADCDARPGASTCLTSDVLWPIAGPQRFAFVPSPETPPPSRFSLALVSSWQKRPIDLHVATPGPSGTDASAIDDQVNSTIAAAFGVTERIAALVAIPVTLYEDGGGASAVTRRPAPAGSSLRDPRLGGAVGLVRSEHVGLTALLQAQVPTRATTDFAGEKGVAIVPGLTADARLGDRVLVAATLGARVRPAPQSFFGERQGTQGIAGLGVSVDLLPRRLLAVGAESHLLVGFDGRSDVTQDRFGLATSSARTVTGGEWLGSLRSSFLSDALSVLVGGGGTLPLDGLVGVGRVRAVLGLSFTPPAPAAPREEPARPPPPREEPVVRPAPPPPPAPTRPPAPGTCEAICRADSYSPLPPDDQRGLATAMKPLLEELRACLDRVEARRVQPFVVVRFAEDGTQTNARIDVGGFEDLGCAKDARAHIPVYRAARGTGARCELRCTAR